MLKGFLGYVRELLEDTEALESDGSSSGYSHLDSCELDDDVDAGDDKGDARTKISANNNPRGHGHKRSSKRDSSTCSSRASTSSQGDGHRVESDAFVDKLFVGERDTERSTSLLVSTHTQFTSDVRRATAISLNAVRSMKATTMLPPPRHQRMFRRPLFVVFDLDGTLLKETLSSSLTADLLSRYRRHVEDAHVWEERLNSCFTHANTKNNNNTNIDKNTQRKTFSHELHFITTNEKLWDSKEGEQHDVEDGSQSTDPNHRPVCNVASDTDIPFLLSQYKRSLRELDTFAKTVVGTVFKDPSFVLNFLAFLHGAKGHYVRIATFAQESTEAKIGDTVSPFRFAPHTAATHTNASSDVDAQHLQGCDLKRSLDLPACDHAPTPLFSASSSFAACAQEVPPTRAWCTRRPLGKNTPLLGGERRGSSSPLTGIQSNERGINRSTNVRAVSEHDLQHGAKRSSVVDFGLFQATDDLGPSGGGDLDALFSLVAVGERDVNRAASSSAEEQEQLRREEGGVFEKVSANGLGTERGIHPQSGGEPVSIEVVASSSCEISTEENTADSDSPATLGGVGRLQVQSSTQQPVHVHSQGGDINGSPSKGGEGHAQQTQLRPFDEDDGLRPSIACTIIRSRPFTLDVQGPSSESGKEEDVLFSIARRPCRDSTGKEPNANISTRDSTNIAGSNSNSVDISGEESCSSAPNPTTDDSTSEAYQPCLHQQWGSFPPPNGGDTCSNRNLFTISTSTSMHLYDVSAASVSANYFKTTTAATAANNCSITTVVLSRSPPRSQNTFRRGSSVSMATSGLGLQTSSSGNAAEAGSASYALDLEASPPTSFPLTLHNNSISGSQLAEPTRSQSAHTGTNKYDLTRLLLSGGQQYTDLIGMGNFSFTAERSQPDQHVSICAKRKKSQRAEDSSLRQLRQDKEEEDGEGTVSVLERRRSTVQNEDKGVSPPMSTPLEKSKGSPPLPSYLAVSPSTIGLFHSCPVQPFESPLSPQEEHPHPHNHHAMGHTTRDALRPAQWIKETDGIRMLIQAPEGGEKDGDGDGDTCVGYSYSLDHASTATYYATACNSYQGGLGRGAGIEEVEGGGRGEESGGPLPSFCSSSVRSKGDRSRDYSLRAAHSSYATAQGIHEAPFSCPSRRSSYGEFASENDALDHLDDDDDDDNVSSLQQDDRSSIDKRTVAALSACTTVVADDQRAPQPSPRAHRRTIEDTAPPDAFACTVDISPLGSYVPTTDNEGNSPLRRHLMVSIDSKWEVDGQGQGHEGSGLTTDNGNTNNAYNELTPPKHTDSVGKSSIENINRQLDMGTEHKTHLLMMDERARYEGATNASAPAANVSYVVSGGPSLRGRKEGTAVDPSDLAANSSTQDTGTFSASTSCHSPTRLSLATFPSTNILKRAAGVDMWSKMRSSDGDAFGVAGVDGRTPHSDKIMLDVPHGVGSAQRSYDSDKERALGSYLPQPTSIVGSGEFVPEEGSCGRSGGRRQRDSLRSEFDYGSRNDPSRMRRSAENSEFRGCVNKTPPRSPPILSELGSTFPLGFAFGAQSTGTPLRRVNANYPYPSENTVTFRNPRAADPGRTWENRSAWGQAHANTKRENYVTFSPSVLPQAFAHPGTSELARVQDTPAEWVSSGVLPPYTYASGSFASSQTPIHSSFTPTQLHNGSFPMAAGRASPHPPHTSYEARMGPGGVCFLTSLIDTSYSDPNGHGLGGSGRAAMGDESPVPMIRPAVSYRRHLRGDVGTSRSQSHGSLPSSFSSHQGRASTHTGSPLPRKGLTTGELSTKGAPHPDHRATSVSASGFFDAPHLYCDGNNNQDARVEGRESGDRSQQITPHTVPTLYMQHRGYDKKEDHQHSPTHAQYASHISVRFPSEPTPLHLSPDRGGIWRRRNVGAEPPLRTPNGAGVGQAMGNTLASSAVGLGGLGLPPTPPRGGFAGSKRAASTIMSSSQSAAEVPRTCVSSPVATLVIATDRDHPATSAGGEPLLDCEEWKDPLAVHVHTNEVDQDISPPRPGANHQASSTRRPSLNYPQDEGNRCLTFSPADLAVMTSDRGNAVDYSRAVNGGATVDVLPKSRSNFTSANTKRSELHRASMPAASLMREQTPLGTVCGNSSSNRRFAVHDILDLLDALCSTRDFLVEGHDIIGWRGPSTLIGGFLHSRSRLSLTGSTASRQHSRQTVWGDEEEDCDEDIFDDDDPLPEGSENKNPHINVLLEDFMVKNPQLSRRPVSPSRVVLIDDDVNNVKAAVAVGYNAFHCPNGLTREWYASQTKLQHLLDAFEGSDF